MLYLMLWINFSIIILESPRWLILHDKEDKAVKTLRQIADINGRGSDFPSGELHFKEEKALAEKVIETLVFGINALDTLK